MQKKFIALNSPIYFKALSEKGDPGYPDSSGMEKVKTEIHGIRPLWLTDELINTAFEKIEWDDLDTD